MNLRCIYLGAFCILFGTIESAAALSLTLCGVSDNGPGDLDGRESIVAVRCNLNAGEPVAPGAPASGSFEGSAQETNIHNSDHILVNGFARGAGSLPVSNSYNFDPGRGVLGTAIGGELVGPPGTRTTGAEMIIGTATASSFDMNPAVASFHADADRPLPVSFQDSDFKNGNYAGSGNLMGILEWNTGMPFVPFPAAQQLTGQQVDGESDGISFSGDLMAAVPEPSTMLLLATGLLAIGIPLYRRKPESS
jgi:hypothetical protein